MTRLVVAALLVLVSTGCAGTRRGATVDVSGRWEGYFVASALFVRSIVLTLEQDGSSLTGQYAVEHVGVGPPGRPVTGTIAGDTLSLAIGTGSERIHTTVVGDRMHGMQTVGIPLQLILVRTKR